MQMPFTPDFSGLRDLREQYLSELNRRILFRNRFENENTRRLRESEGWKGDDPIVGADVGNVKSLWIMEHWAASLPGSLGVTGVNAVPQRYGARYETLLTEYLNEGFTLLERAGVARAAGLNSRRGPQISTFDQYSHLSTINSMLEAHQEIEAVFGRDYNVKPDVVVYRQRESPAVLGGRPNDSVAQYSPFFNDARFAQNERRTTRGRVEAHEANILEAIISCKFTIRSDRAQNIRTEAGSAIRMRKGRLPHIVAVTAEPMCGGGRLESIALGSGEIDCVYHSALPELARAMESANATGELAKLRALITTRRIRDISDLLFDLVT